MNADPVKFSDLLKHTELLDYLSTLDFEQPTPIQAVSIPALLKDGNYTIQGRTGSGKTLAYLLPLIQKIKQAEARMASLPETERPRIPKGSPAVLVVAPTRELALQIYDVAKNLAYKVPLRIRKLVGGDKGKALKTMWTAPMDILITTPDRCLRVIKKGEFNKFNLMSLVLDEADQLLEPSFKKTMLEMCHAMSKESLQVVLVSASRPGNFFEVIDSYFPGRKFSDLGTPSDAKKHSLKIQHFYVTEDDKFMQARVLIHQTHNNGLVFVGNKTRAERLYKELQDIKRKTYLLHKDLDIAARTQIVEKFREKGGIIIATDIFARGIDVPHLNWVLNFDMPTASDYYLHRCGRVGRAGRQGEVYNFIAPGDTKRLEKINLALQRQGRQDLQIISKNKLEKKKKSAVKAAALKAAKGKKGPKTSKDNKGKNAKVVAPQRKSKTRRSTNNKKKKAD